MRTITVSEREAMSLEKCGWSFPEGLEGDGKRMGARKTLLSWSSGYCWAVAEKPAVISKWSASLGWISWECFLRSAHRRCSGGKTAY